MNITEAGKLASDLMRAHGLTNWTLEKTQTRGRFGSCDYRHKIIRLSEPLTLLNNPAEVKNVILHEIAHALVKPNSGHNKIWKAKAQSIGCTGLRTYPASVIQPPALYSTICPNGHTNQRNKKTRVSCGTCSNKFNKKYLLKFTKNIEREEV